MHIYIYIQYTCIGVCVCMYIYIYIYISCFVRERERERCSTRRVLVCEPLDLQKSDRSSGGPEEPFSRRRDCPGRPPYFRDRTGRLVSKFPTMPRACLHQDLVSVDLSLKPRLISFAEGVHWGP